MHRRANLAMRSRMLKLRRSASAQLNKRTVLVIFNGEPAPGALRLGARELPWPWPFSRLPSRNLTLRRIISLAFGRPMPHPSPSSDDIEDPDGANRNQHREKSILASASPGLSALPQSSDGLKLQSSFDGWP